VIPSFPQFKPLTLEDARAVDAHTSRFPSYSDYNFSSLWAWDVRRNRELSELHGNLVVKFTDYASGEPFFSFLGTNERLLTARTLLDYSEALGMQPALHLVPEVSVQELESEALTVIADPASFDYVYLAQTISALPGGAFKSKRRAIRLFEEAHPEHDFSIWPLTHPVAQESVRAIAGTWRKRRDPASENKGLTHELRAIEACLELGSQRNMLVGIVRTAGIPTSFSLEEPAGASDAISHFSKSAHATVGENEYLSRETATYLMGRAVTHLNWEEDLGIEALRASKTSYRPSLYLKKFIIARANTDRITRRSVRP